MSLKLIEFDVQKILQILQSKTAPIMEVELLRELLNKRHLPGSREKIFDIHFSLYHSLYKLKYDVDKNGYYLYLDPMKIKLTELPERYHCLHYFSDKGMFCSNPIQSLASYRDDFPLQDIPVHIHDIAYCQYHIRQYIEILDKISFDPLYEFYMNSENIVFGTSKILNKLMDGVILYAMKKGEVKNAMDFFGITYPNKIIVQKRYYELAKVYHPDKLDGDDSMMKKLNSYYQVLKEIFVI